MMLRTLFFFLIFLFLGAGWKNGAVIFAQDTGASASGKNTGSTKPEALLDTLNENSDSAKQVLVPTESEPEVNADGGVDETFNEDEFLFNYEGPTVDVIHDNRSGSDYVRVYSKNEAVEYHYLNQIKYSDLVFVLTDLLKRITEDGYRWADDLSTDFEKYMDEPAIIYKVDKVYDKVYGMVQFPDFRIWFSGTKEPNGTNRHDALKPSVMQGLIMQFMFALAHVEDVLGINQLEYGKKFFKDSGQ
ncbi:MAG: hypothetical protein Ta2F_04560 [Termitinemataceae bacterium]|nr:MAG: hypothetical protein Ta2F_04560 [Termitinemataceae bacterium]